MKKKNNDPTAQMNDWEYAKYNMYLDKQDRINALIKKYGYPVNERNLLPEDYAEYDLLKDDLEAPEQQQLASLPMPQGTSLNDNDTARNAAIVKAKREEAQNERDEEEQSLKKLHENSQNFSQNNQNDTENENKIDATEESNQQDSIEKRNNDDEIQQLKTNLSNLGYYRGKIDNIQTPELIEAASEFAQDHQMNEQNLDNSLDKIAEKLKSIKKPARLDFDGKYLRFIHDGKLVLVLHAMSGQPEYQNRKYQNVRNKGPLPEGSYRVKQNRIQDIDALQAIKGMAKIIGIKAGTFPGSYYSWGKTRVWLEPFASNNMYGRDNFTIHGGATLGSAGCIDIPGHTKEFFDILRKYGKDIILNVHYDKEKLQ